ncbi:protein disulfide-isomerase precursor [Coemansia sp. Benny D115]|nr:protein disulfide-isomerase precursor [Coemansia sp. Benny D115]
MKHGYRHAAVLFTTALLATAGLADSSLAKTGESAVHVLGESNFKHWTSAQSLALVEFYAPWCGYCQAMAPAYDMAAASLKDDGIPLAKVDCTKEKAICDDQDVQGYPTLKVLKDGSFSAYNGTRQEASIVSYMRRHANPALEKVEAKGFDGFAKSGHMVVVGFFDEGSREKAALEAVAGELRDEYVFGYVSDRTTALKKGVPFPGLVVFKDFDTRKDTFDATGDVDRLRSIVRASSVPVLGELSSQTFGRYARAGIPIGLVFYDTAESRSGLESELLSTAIKYKQKLSMALVDARVYHRHAKTLNLKKQWPAFAIQDTVKQLKYLYPQGQTLTGPGIEQFVGDYVEGRIEPDFKSQPVPASNSGGVFELVAKQFNEVVFDATKDVLVEFYAPWCLYCKRIAGVYAELGEMFKGNSDIVIARMDGTANDVPSSDPALQVPGFPTIVLVRAGDNAIIPYKGNRTLKSFEAFIRTNAVRAGTHAQESADAGAGAEAGHGAERQHAYVEAPSHVLGFTPKENRHDEL